MRNRRLLQPALASSSVLLAFGGQSFAQVDNLRVLVDKANAAGAKSLGASAWQPGDTYYTATFGAGAGVLSFFKIAPDGSGGQTVSQQVTETELRTFYNDGDATRSSGTPIISGLVLNPVAVGSFPAYSFAIVTDIAQTSKPGTSSVNDPDVTKRIYRYNLQQVTTGDGREVFTSLVTQQNLNAAKGAAPTNTSSNVGRQGAFSTDGGSYYFIDSAATLGGIYRTNVLTGGATLLLNYTGINTEPAVLPKAGGGDRILFAGTAATSNDGGVNEIEQVGSTTSGQKTFIQAAELAGFLERATGTTDVRAITTDAAGNVYLFDTTSKVLVRRDPQGRLSKVTSQAERNAFLGQVGKTGTVNGNQLRLQARPAAHPTAGQVTEIVYAEQSSQNFVAGAYAFAAGDFNRDGSVGPADALLLKPVLTARGVPQTNAANFKFDLNGNGAVDWKDVKVFQQFFPFDDGDADISQAVNYGDLDILAGASYPKASGATWVQGDFTGDSAVTLADLTLVAANWDLTTPTKADFDARGYAGAFRSDLESAFGLNVPEPGSALAAAAAVGGGLLARRRSRRG
jgi:hypothetical protein